MCGICAVFEAVEGANESNREDAEDVALRRRGPDACGSVSISVGKDVGLAKVKASVLNLRGNEREQANQPKRDAKGNVLAFNGEVYRAIGFEEQEERNDTQFVMERLARCGDEGELMAAVEQMEGPWAMVYWQAESGTMYFGRDRLGRRSLMVQKGLGGGNLLRICSVSPAENVAAEGWEEIPPDGLYRVTNDQTGFGFELCLPWPERKLEICTSEPIQVDPESVRISGEKLLEVLSEAVRLRVQCNNGSPIAILFSGGLDCTVIAALVHKYTPPDQPIDLLNVCFKKEHDSPDRQSAIESWKELRHVFSGRKWNLVCIDSSLEEIKAQERHIFSLVVPNTTHMDFNIGAALWFASSGRGKLFKEEAIIADGEFDHSREACLAKLLRATDGQTMAEMQKRQPPSGPIHCALKGPKCSGIGKLKCSFKACGICCKAKQGESGELCSTHKLSKGKKRRKIDDSKGDEFVSEAKSKPLDSEIYCSPARILFSGLGADELMGGYGRHRVEFKKGGWTALREEMDRDVARLWKRNLGRDDRCIADQSKEVRQPFLDENVIRFLSSLPVSHIVDPSLGQGLGEKRLLRVVCCLLGLPNAAQLAKRAIQFGTRVAQLSRGSAEGSNRSFKADTPYKLDQI